MGTASTMNSLAEALGMSCPAAPPSRRPTASRQIAYETGKRIVEMVWEDLKPSEILTRKAFENAIVVNSAIGGSTNAPIHINAIARTSASSSTIDDWEKSATRCRCWSTCSRPASISARTTPPRRRRAGGGQRADEEGQDHGDAMTVNGKTIGENCRAARSS
jgi:dihydroxy-acid dehydratase